MARSEGSFRYHLRSFFTNWREYEGPFGTKVRLTLRNRVRALTRGCCGHPGEPGC
jgi:hypothetical protein